MSLRYAVLGLIAELDGASGYDLLKMFEISLANVWPATQSQLYGELGKLADAGLIDAADEGPRGRREYAITEAGRAELHRWLLEIKPRKPMRDETLLRVFLLGNVTSREAQEYMRAETDRLDEALDGLAALDETVEWDDDDLSRYGRLVIEYGRRSIAMRRDWFEWARAEMRSFDEPAG
ncbi:PadR family transcriptional regulator [Actinomadura algeriensis]|uniref:DNA-binding PadR family transcriptional regulator n=1 Tax=Actinomadura algeriensis TaxID=1679523 RepID=A0ABR9JL06_9ACTN|nr:PadR family transcriptional regulator [Actinomadura algeriensis]MBE1531108.1 DNA-binding PadR family transcriptional regulator [Actinomadura algeriensis]